MAQTPMDWQKDMEMCKAATPGPWQTVEVADGAFVLDAEYNVVAAMVEHTNDTVFIAESRESLPHWLKEAQKWREEALRQYPTPEAYEAACTALEKHRARADAAEARIKELERELNSKKQLLRETDQSRTEVREMYRSVCDVAQEYKDNLELAEAREQRLKPEIGKCLVAGNSLGSVIMSYNLPTGHEDWTFQQASTYFYETYARETAHERYEIWLAWTAIMGVSQNLSTLYPDTPRGDLQGEGDPDTLAQPAAPKEGDTE